MGYTIGTLSARQTSSGNPATLAVTILPGENLFTVTLVCQSATNRAGGALTLSGGPGGTYTLVQAGTTQKAAASPEASAELWYCLNPMPGTYTLTIPNTNAAGLAYHACRAKTRAGMIAIFIAAAGGNGTSTNPTASVVSVEGNLILFSVVGSGAQSWGPSARNGTQISDTDAGAFGDGHQYLITASAGTQAMGWTFGTSDDWGVCAGSFGESDAPKLEAYMGVAVGDGMGTNERIR